MATYAIGDIQGCFEPFQRLLQLVEFRPDRDRLWLAGDLVNRGPSSLEVLRWVRAHHDNVQVVLGNHEIHLLQRAAGKAKKKLDALQEVLAVPKLIEWVRRQPLIHREDDAVLVHAGVAPRWTWDEIERRAEVAHAALRGGKVRFKGEVDETVAVLTRIRMVDRQGRPKFGFAGHPDEAPEGQLPWFEAERKTADLTVFFGHWAAFGHAIGDNWVALDSACVWGGALTAVRLEDRAVFQVSR